MAKHHKDHPDYGAMGIFAGYGEFDEPDFADPGGRSALRAARKDNPRNLPCPNCGKKNRLTPADRALGYQCDSCADRAEGRFGGSYGEY